MSLRAIGFLLLAFATVGAFVLSERVAAPPPQKGRVTITYWEKWTGIEGDAMRAVVDAFNRSQDRIFVNYLSISGVNVKTMLATAAGVPPDVCGLFDSDVSQFADDGALMPLEGYCERARIRKEDYISVYWNIGDYRGHVYALPTTPASTALHYNTRLFREAGLDPDRPPRTIEEMDAFTEKLSKRKPDGTLRQFGFFHADPGWWNFGWGAIFGARFWNGKDRITATHPGFVRALEWVRSYSLKYGVKDLQGFRSGFGNFSSPQNAFMAEKVAMQLQGVWMSNHIGKHNPKLQWAAAPFPHPADRPDLAGTTFVACDMIAIPVGSKHPDEAFEFIRFVQKQSSMEMLCTLQGKHSPLADASAEFIENHPNPYVRIFTDLPRGTTAIVPPALGIWPEYRAEMVVAFEEVALLQKSPEEALDRVQRRMQPKLEQYLRTIARREAAR